MSFALVEGANADAWVRYGTHEGGGGGVCIYIVGGMKAKERKEGNKEVREEGRKEGRKKGKKE